MRRCNLFLPLLIVVLNCADGPPPPPDEPAAAPPILLVSQKAVKSIAWYTLGGEKLDEVVVSHHPHEIVHKGDRLYVTDNGVMQIENAGEGGNKVSVVDLTARERIAEVDLGEYYRPHGISVCGDGTLLVTTENPDQLLIADIGTHTVSKTYPTGGETPHIVTCSSDSRFAYVSNARSRTVAKIELASGATELLETGDRPEGQCISRDGTRLFVAHRNGDKLAILDTVEWKVLREIPTGAGPVRCGLNGDESIISYGMVGDEAIGFANIAEGVELGQIKLSGPAVSLEMHGDDTALTCAQDAGVCYVVSVSEQRIRHEVTVAEGAGPDPALLLE